MQIPWRIKSTVFALTDVVGENALYLAQRYVGGRGGVPRSPSWDFHLKNLREAGARTSIEFGAGKHLGMALFLSQLGIKQTAVDLFRMIDFDLVNRAIDTIDGVPAERHVASEADLIEYYGIDYRAPLDMQHTPFASGSFDACVSTNTLEHIPADVIRGIWKETFRLLAPGGIVSAKIDYSDHYAHTDRSVSRINYLRFSETEWRRYNHRNHFQNRLRHKHHLDMLVQAGFEIVSETASLPEQPNGIPVRLENLTGHATDYCTEGFVLARKPS